MKETLAGLQRNRRGAELFQLIVEDLQRKAEIRLNPEVIKQIGG